MTLFHGVSYFSSYVWVFILISFVPVAELSRRYKEDGMLAYIELVQQKERELGVDILTHQKWYVLPTLMDKELVKLFT